MKYSLKRGPEDGPWNLIVVVEDSDINTAVLERGKVHVLLADPWLGFEAAICSAITHAINAKVDDVGLCRQKVIVYRGESPAPRINFCVELDTSLLTQEPSGINPDSTILQAILFSAYPHRDHLLDKMIPFPRDLFRQLPQLGDSAPWCNNISVLPGHPL
tara:strand:+ start:126 stop:605 length:480 start_codon:yes stop_codon:yes gene_type:complete